MKRLVFFTQILLALLVLPGWSLGADEKSVLKISTTTSTQASGLLDQLLPAFEEASNIRVKVIAKGTGAAIRDGMDGNVDLIFVHDMRREKKFIDAGYGVKRYAVMHNDFVIVGPKEDPAGISGLKDAALALKKITDAGQTFLSRGDDSGTHSREQYLWKKSGVPVETKNSVIVKKGAKKQISSISPASSKKSYVSIGQGMGATLTFADEKRAYTLADRGTYIKYKYGAHRPITLDVLCESDPELSNPYGVIPVHPKKHPHTNAAAANAFAEWVVSEKGQAIIRDYKLLGKTLFYPDAIK